MNEQEEARYKAYVTWKRLTHNGRRIRAEMSEEQQEEYDSFGFEERSEVPDYEATKRAYLVVADQ